MTRDCYNLTQVRSQLWYRVAMSNKSEHSTQERNANSAPKLAEFPIHLGLNAVASSQPAFTGGVAWYQGYGERNAADGKEGRLVSMHTFSEPWDVWEMHPEGHEVVVCTAGEITLIQEQQGEVNRVTLRAGEYAINDPGVWHTADVNTKATALFITAGMGTEHKPRKTE